MRISLAEKMRKYFMFFLFCSCFGQYTAWASLEQNSALTHWQLQGGSHGSGYEDLTPEFLSAMSAMSAIGSLEAGEAIMIAQNGSGEVDYQIASVTSSIQKCFENFWRSSRTFIEEYQPLRVGTYTKFRSDITFDDVASNIFTSAAIVSGAAWLLSELGRRVFRPSNIGTYLMMFAVATSSAIVIFQAARNDIADYTMNSWAEWQKSSLQ